MKKIDDAEVIPGETIHRNNEVMRIYWDMYLAEQLGSGIPEIL